MRHSIGPHGTWHTPLCFAQVPSVAEKFAHLPVRDLQVLIALGCHGVPNVRGTEVGGQFESAAHGPPIGFV